MTTLEKLRSSYMSYDRWYYHLVLDSLGERNLFNDRDEYVNGMNAVALAQFVKHVGVIQFDLMRNHAHFVVLATGRQCCDFFDCLRRRLNSRLIRDGYPPLHDKWFFRLYRLGSLSELVNAVSYSARNSYDARTDILPSGYLWSSNYAIFSEIGEIIGYQTVESIGVTGMSRLLSSKVRLPEDYKVCKLGYVLPESYLLGSDDGSMTKARSLYKDSKDYSYRIFKDYGTYRRVAAQLGEAWTPSGSDADSIMSYLLGFKYGVGRVEELDADRRCDLVVTLEKEYGLSIEAIASRTNMSPSYVSKLIYSYSKNTKGRPQRQ